MKHILKKKINNMPNYDILYEGLDNLTERQIETLCYRLGLKVTINQNHNFYELIIGNYIASSRKYNGIYIKNSNFPEIY